MQYKEVFLVNWNRWSGTEKYPPVDSDSCKPVFDEDLDAPNLPTTTIFDLDSGNTPALSFYSRYHINLVIIPELKVAIEAQTAILTQVEKKSRICCSGTKKGSCLGKEAEETFRNCDDDDISFETTKRNQMQVTLDGWKYMKSIEATAKEQAIANKGKISDWFESVNSLSQVIEKKQEGNNLVKDEDTIASLAEDIGIDLLEDQHYANLLPEELVERAVPYTNVQSFGDEEEFKTDRESIRNTMRLQISGDAGMLSVSLSEDAMRTYEHQNCNIATPLAVAGIAGLVAGGTGMLLAGPLLPLAVGALVFGPAMAGCNFGKSFDCCPKVASVFT